MQENDSTSSGIDLMTWLNFEAAVTRNPRVAQSLRDSAAEIGHLRTQLKAAGISNYNELTSALRDMTRTAEVVLTTPHLQIEQRENARADMAESVRYCKKLMQSA